MIRYIAELNVRWRTEEKASGAIPPEWMQTILYKREKNTRLVNEFYEVTWALLDEGREMSSRDSSERIRNLDYRGQLPAIEKTSEARREHVKAQRRTPSTKLNP